MSCTVSVPSPSPTSPLQKKDSSEALRWSLRGGPWIELVSAFPPPFQKSFQAGRRVEGVEGLDEVEVTVPNLFDDGLFEISEWLDEMKEELDRNKLKGVKGRVDEEDEE